jgi:hypothetical protein
MKKISIIKMHGTTIKKVFYFLTYWRQVSVIRPSSFHFYIKFETRLHVVHIKFNIVVFETNLLLSFNSVTQRDVLYKKKSCFLFVTFQAGFAGFSYKLRFF